MPLAVDTSAIVAILLGEPGWEPVADEITAPGPHLISAATRVELGIVVEARLGPAGTDALHRLLRDADVRTVPLDADAAERALSAWRRFGKGRHPAGLNLGDCFSYALADRSGLSLLCVGDDFAATDLAVVPARSGQRTGR